MCPILDCVGRSRDTQSKTLPDMPLGSSSYIVRLRIISLTNSPTAQERLEGN